MQKNKYLILIFLAINFIFPLLTFAADQNELLGKDCKDSTESPGPDDLQIKYMGNSSLGYGKSATASAQPYKMIVFHWPGSSSCNLDAAVNYGLTVDSSRGGQFGYTFYIGTDGTIAQGAPINKRTNHVGGKNRRAGAPAFSNSYAMGISLVCSEKKASSAQLEAAKKLGQAVMAGYGIPASNIYGHGDLQTDRDAREGQEAKSALKGASGNPPKKIFYTLKDGKKIVCGVDGKIPEQCTGSYCLNVPGSPPPPGSFYPPGSFGQPPGSKYISDGNDWRYPFQQPNNNGQLNYPQNPPLLPTNSNNPYANNPQNPAGSKPSNGSGPALLPTNNSSNPYLPQTNSDINPYLDTATPTKTKTKKDTTQSAQSMTTEETKPITSKKTVVTQKNKICSDLFIQKNTDDYYRLVDQYNVTYFDQYGDWRIVKDSAFPLFDFKFILAKINAKNIYKVFLNLNQCDVRDLLI